jgi:hypothetical protein
MEKYNLKKDHKKLKELIKEWEISNNWILDSLLNIQEEYGDIVVSEDGEQEEIRLSSLIDEVEGMGNEMTAINI